MARVIADRNAKIDAMAMDVPASLFASLNEIERMFDEMGGLPQLGKQHGAASRSAGHAETMIRMYSPRFKDRAILVERSVEELGGLMLDIARVHEPKRLLAWVPEKEAGPQGGKVLEGLNPPAPGLVPVYFTFADLDGDVALTVDAHSSSPCVRSVQDRRHVRRRRSGPFGCERPRDLDRGHSKAGDRQGRSREAAATGRGHEGRQALKASRAGLDTGFTVVSRGFIPARCVCPSGTRVLRVHPRRRDEASITHRDTLQQ